MTVNEAVVKGDDSLRMIRNGQDVTVTVAFREGKLPSSPGMQSHSINITVDELVALLGKLGLEVKSPE